MKRENDKRKGAGGYEASDVEEGGGHGGESAFVMVILNKMVLRGVVQRHMTLWGVIPVDSLLSDHPPTHTYTHTHIHLAFAFVLCKKLPSLCFISCFFFSSLKTLLYSPSNSPLKRRRSSLDPPCVHK